MTKTHILTEIKRTAAANGGRPLGRVRFQAETGIKESDWYGRFWATWGEAIAEAGLAPNRLNPGLGEELLLRRYADLLLQLGRVPRSADLRLKRREDPTLPSHNTYARFGSKADLLQRIRGFAASQPDQSEILAVVGPPDPNLEPVADDKPADVPIGFVYLIKSGRHYKIGRTNALGRREYELAIQLPEKANTVHVIKTDDPAGIESYWHQRFAPKRANGEWFSLSAADVGAFKRRKFM